MRGQALFIAILLTSAVAAQAPQSPNEAAQTRMATPPPVSGLNYANQVGSEVQRNYLRGGLTYSTSYIDNYFADSGSAPIAETTFSILPMIALDTSTEKQHAVVTYSPGFTFYRPSSGLNEVDNTAAADYAFHLSAYTTISAMERFEDSSLPFSPTDSSFGGISGLPVSTTPGVVPPFAKRLTNLVSAEITMQTGLNEMIGASGLATVLHYPGSSPTLGLYNSNSRGGTGFYDHRISSSQYVGVTYQYLDMLTSPPDGESATKTSTVMGFYTIYPRAQLSLSVSGGPQRYQVTETASPSFDAWGPAVSASMGWQTGRASLAASYSHSVTGAGGLIGAYHTNSANAAFHWQLARTWTAGASGAYSINKSVSALLPTEAENGHTIFGSATLQHPIHGQVSLAFGYDRVHQSYGQVAAIAASPDSDRVSVSVSWNFQHELGR
ncbi:hypothetical protein [Terracidiphilus sp.]|jgi:hypothetical protein|uniref:hypothetical protein n=1 Tax=Terracidiphilus sp. TaxID=1964191 RepID=UPI003C2416F4